jgi:aldehyde oxidoreductase
VDNIRGAGYTLFTNQKWCGAFRAYGAPQTYFAGEQIIDMLAEKVGMDTLFQHGMSLKRGSISSKD